MIIIIQLQVDCFKVPALKTVSCNPLGSLIDGHIENNPSPRTSMTSLSTSRASPLSSSSSYSSSANVDPSNIESLATISHLLVQPSLPGQDPYITKEHFYKVLRYLSMIFKLHTHIMWIQSIYIVY